MDDVRLVPLDRLVLDALAVPDVETASDLLGLTVPVEVGDECWLWRMRAEQLDHSPGDLPWIARLLAVGDDVVGHVGFHAAPDAAGAVELGYWVLPARRGQGLGAAALRLLERWGREAPQVRTLVASVAPSNEVSTHLVLAAGYTVRGEVWDDGEPEVVHELDVSGGP